MAKGLLIIFEGMEKTGKSTQKEFLAQYMRNKGRTVVLTKEPGGGIAKNRKEILEGLEQRKLSQDALREQELRLFIEDRTAHYKNLIIPSLELGSVVISDRGPDSTVAYQGYARGMNIMRIGEKNAIATQGRESDVTILFDMPPSEIKKRIQKDSSVEITRFENESIDFHERVRNGYLAIASQNPDRWLVINATSPRDEITQVVVCEIERRFF